VSPERAAGPDLEHAFKGLDDTKPAKAHKPAKTPKAPKAPKPPKPAKEKKKGGSAAKIIIGVVIAIVVIAAVAIVVLFSNHTIGNGGLAARVNGNGITTKQLDASVAKLKLQNPQVFTANSGISTAQIRSSLLDELINEQLILQDAKSKGVTITDAQVTQQINAIKKQYGSDKQFNAVLQQQGYTLDSLKTQLQYQLAAQGIAKKLVPDNSVSTKDAQDYYNANKKNYILAAGKQISQIKFALSDSTKAADVLRQLNGGANFATLAQKNSTDAASAARGGVLGWTPMNPPLDKSLQEAVNNLNKGDISGVIQSSTGLFILKVTDVRDSSEQPFSAVEASIKATLLNTKRNTASQQLLTNLRKSAKIVIYDKVVKDYRDQKPATPATTNSSSSSSSSKKSDSATTTKK